MSSDALDRWLSKLGYHASPATLHRRGERRHVAHPYWPEIEDLLRPDGEIRARAVFDVDGVPTVCFVDPEDAPLSPERLKALRERIWNQNLISIVVAVEGDRARPYPVVPGVEAGEGLLIDQASAVSAYSAIDVQSGAVAERHPDWFDPGERVDRKLLANLGHLVERLAQGFPGGDAAARARAQGFAGQILFVAYLEHRDIVSTTYQATHGVRPLIELVRARNADGIDALLMQLRADFNGDFLEPDPETAIRWTDLDGKAFETVEKFLSRTDLESGQTEFWPYNFRYIPVELISGLYESFLGPVQKKLGAYYTPRHLANLAVDLAFEGSKDLLAETIFDGACGSGILLTTAFRRLLGEAERRRGDALPIDARIALLRKHIFGSDVSWSACRVTAFSLYLSLLERLQPADIAALQNDQNVKLPALRGTNVLTGAVEGDAFSVENTHAESHRFSIVLSNPPWREPESGEENTALRWAEDHDICVARKQVAGAFAFRLLDSLAPDGRLCLILPMSLLLAPTSATFVRDWLHRVRIDRMINFGDLKELMFETARYSCVVVRAGLRPDPEERIPAAETFDYVVPKADISLAFGRLAVHSSDRHVVQTQTIAIDNQELVTRMWGDDIDLAAFARMHLLGTFDDLFREGRWITRKGLHLEDRHAQSVSAEPFQGRPFVEPPALYEAPVVHPGAFGTFPDLDRLPKYSEDVWKVFEGPRVLFPDGPSADLEIRAVYTDRPVTFKHSIGAIASMRADDADLLKFAAVYLRSDLMRYFLVTQVFQVLADRDRVSLRDVRRMPFVVPERHPDPERARSLVREVARRVDALERAPILEHASLYQQMRLELERHVHDYFALSDDGSALVLETTAEVLPRIRPYGFKSAIEVALRRPTREQMRAYAEQLQHTFDRWRDMRRGTGTVHVKAFATRQDRNGAFGIVRISPDAKAAEPSSFAFTENADIVVDGVMDMLHSHKLLPTTLDENLYLYPDTIIQVGSEIYLLKPLTVRLWLRRRAIRDADRIVDTLIGQQKPPSPLERHVA
jgi:hypothetical protein